MALSIPLNLLPDGGARFAELYGSENPDTNSQEQLGASTTAEDDMRKPNCVAVSERRKPPQRVALIKEAPVAADVCSRGFLDAYSVEALKKLARSMNLSLPKLAPREQVASAIWGRISNDSNDFPVCVSGGLGDEDCSSSPKDDHRIIVLPSSKK